MPSPFPGMDPYLENAVLWPGFHHVLISTLSRTINALLPRHYVARIGERLYVVQERRPIFADVALIERMPARPGAAAGGTATAIATEEEGAPVIVDIEEVTLRQLFIEVRHVGTSGNVVTVLELLSPANKTPGENRDQYVQKQAAVLASPTNLLEIDLLRRGRYTVAVPQGALPADVLWQYLISLHRGARRGRFEVWPILLGHCLPQILVPLAPGDSPIRVDLQAVFTRSYDEGAYDRDLDYTRDPDPPLPPADAAWADALLRQRGLRP